MVATFLRCCKVLLDLFLFWGVQGFSWYFVSNRCIFSMRKKKKKFWESCCCFFISPRLYIPMLYHATIPPRIDERERVGCKIQEIIYLIEEEIARVDREGVRAVAVIVIRSKLGNHLIHLS